MGTPSVVAKSKTATEIRVNEKKWSKTLMAAGWTAMPSVIIERQKVLGLDPIDLKIILHLATYWWTADNKPHPHPAKKTIADALGVTARTVQRRIAALETSGLIKREERRIKGQGSRTNLYHFDGLIKAAQPYAKEKLEGIAERQAARQQAVARKGKAKLHLVKSEEDEG